MNSNAVVTSGFSNPDSKAAYEAGWPDEPDVNRLHENGMQCGSCSFFAPFNEDYGLCCHPDGRHHLETTFEHFTCPSHENEGWGVHSFSTLKENHCLCQGESRECYEKLIALLREADKPRGS